jgi:hypothetical protein
MKAVKIPVEGPVEMIEVGNGWQQFAAAIGGPCKYIEEFRCPLTPDHQLVCVVDEDGQFNGQPLNWLASPLYPVPGYVLAGAVLVLAEGMVNGEPDFIDLPDPDQALHLVKELLETP